MRFQAGAISGNVVRNILAEEGPTGGFDAERVSVVLVTAITKAPGPAKRIEKRLIGGKRWKVGKQS